MLDDLGSAMLTTETKMDNVMKKIAKISKLDDGLLSYFSLGKVHFQTTNNGQRFSFWSA